MTPRALYTTIALVIFFSGLSVFVYFISSQLPDFDRREADNKARDANKRVPQKKKKK